MKTKKQPWPAILLMFLMATLIWFSLISLSRYAITQLEELIQGTFGIALIGNGILLLGNISLILFLTCIAYLLYVKMCGFPIPKRGPLSFILDDPNLRQALDFGVSMRNTYLLLIGLPTTFYAIFLQRSTTVTLFASLLVLLSIYLIDHRKSIQNAASTVIILIVLLFCFTLKLISLQDYSLLGAYTPNVLSFFVSLLFAASLAIRYRRFYEIDHKRHPNESRMIPLTMMTALLFGIYFHTVLLTVNCHFAPRSSGENYRAVVDLKCPMTDLHLKYQKNGKEKYAIIEVHPKLFDRVKEGDTIKLHLHSGRLGWAWYHDHISKRYYD